MVISARGPSSKKAQVPLKIENNIEDQSRPHRYRCSEVEDAMDEVWAHSFMAATIWTLEVHHRRDKDARALAQAGHAKKRASPTDRPLSGASHRKH